MLQEDSLMKFSDIANRVTDISTSNGRDLVPRTCFRSVGDLPRLSL